MFTDSKVQLYWLQGAIAGYSAIDWLHGQSAGSALDLLAVRKANLLIIRTVNLLALGSMMLSTYAMTTRPTSNSVSVCLSQINQNTTLEISSC